MIGAARGLGRVTVEGKRPNRSTPPHRAPRRRTSIPSAPKDRTLNAVESDPPRASRRRRTGRSRPTRASRTLGGHPRRQRSPHSTLPDEDVPTMEVRWYHDRPTKSREYRNKSLNTPIMLFAGGTIPLDGRLRAGRKEVTMTGREPAYRACFRGACAATCNWQPMRTVFCPA